MNTHVKFIVEKLLSDTHSILTFSPMLTIFRYVYRKYRERDRKQTDVEFSADKSYHLSPKTKSICLKFAQ